jgi:hypothetical protein
MSDLHANAVLSRNSIDYVAFVLGAGAAGPPLVAVQSAQMAAGLPGIATGALHQTVEEFGWYSRQHDLSFADEPAVVTFTSGTEGRPKGIVLSHANLADTARRIIDQMQMTAEIREYVGVPVTYSFGMGRFRAICAVGGRGYLPARGFDPLELARMLKAGEVNALSAVPTLLRILLANPEVIGHAGANLRWMEIGSQYMSAEEKRQLRALFPKARIVQHYGLTEASRTTFLDVSGVADESLESVGKPSGKVEVGLGGDGRIRIRGPHVARWRVDAEGLHPLCDDQGWLQTNDLGHWNNGYLYFDGRADDLINSAGVKIVPDVLEEKIRIRLGAAARIAVARVSDETRGDAVLAVIEGSDSDLPRLKEAAAAALGEMGADAAGSLHVASVGAIPVTATGKPLRRELTAGFEARRPKPPAAVKPAADTASNVLGVYQRVFPGVAVAPTDTFESLGGDSLRYIQFSMHYERSFGPLPERWESLKVSQLQGMVTSDRRHAWVKLESATLFRAIAMMLIIGRHTDAFEYSRKYGAGDLLIILGGYALARFQLPEILRTGSVKNVLGTALRFAIPTILIVGPSQILTHTFEPLQYLLVSNFLDPAAPVRANWVSFYYAEIYIQLLLLAALLFSFPRVREQFKVRPFASACAVFVVAVVLKYVTNALWDTAYTFHRVPQWWDWLFALGLMVGLASLASQRWLVLVLVAACSYLYNDGISGGWMVIVTGVGMVLFVPSVPVPKLVKLVVAQIAGASMFIYLAHYEVIPVMSKFTHGVLGWPALVACVLVGLVFTHAYGYLERLLSGTRFGRRIFGSLAT